MHPLSSAQLPSEYIVHHHPPPNPTIYTAKENSKVTQKSKLKYTFIKSSSLALGNCENVEHIRLEKFLTYGAQEEICLGHCNLQRQSRTWSWGKIQNFNKLSDIENVTLNVFCTILLRNFDLAYLQQTLILSRLLGFDTVAINQFCLPLIWSCTLVFSHRLGEIQ